MNDSHPLDRPVWSALATGWAHLAEGDDKARRLTPSYGPFGAAVDGSPESLAALLTLVPEAGELWLVDAGTLPAVPGTRVARRAVLNQMLAASVAPSSTEIDVIELTDDDAPEMVALAALTRPGPFAAHTNRLGGFIGIREAGRLVAMAGERMRVTGFAEVSGVCTHPDHRGRGHAGTLMGIVASRILARGETPFLHTYPDNAGAIALYEKLGFRLRAPVNMAILTRD